ncbi:MAG: response regulator transcription factor [Ignavibacteria bacterium]|nr:response regulator transcription factor [Ignavibacteria bacterium]MBP6510162.1 response regulator transcription factor [Candidatus Kapabacteria bacterium]MBK6420351.1 response regulator transcription factor [Ignavibacteria bacterium]MBK6761678.1 response regulator transcription factor [Ignavibacteria bacterium]MBK7033709.1 response regulator transcription factor [Ignavibacteria bacterium]
MLNILIADDHDIFIEALVSLLQDSAEINVLATASTGQDAVRLVEEHPEADVLVLDISMPMMDGIEALAEIRKSKNMIPVLMLTQEYAGGTISRAMKAGASGYVLKTAGRDEFMLAIATVARGEEYISDAAKASLIQRVTGKKEAGENIPLTRAELEVLRLVANGKTTKEIAEQLFVSPFTVETHRRNLLQKLSLRNAAALVRYAIENGLADE